jgi:hypothetical protein
VRLRCHRHAGEQEGDERPQHGARGRHVSRARLRFNDRSFNAPPAGAARMYKVARASEG